MKARNRNPNDGEPPKTVVHVNDHRGEHNKNTMSNYVSTTKYNMFSFLPKALYEQFRRVANLYFTMVAALSCTAMSPISPVTTIAPLVFVIGLSVIKEGYEDFQRYKADKFVNNSLVLVCRGGEWTKVRWQDVKVGEVVKVLREENFPADVVFLSSTIPEGNCYVETANLDGETNLKIKRSVEQTQGLIEGADSQNPAATQLMQTQDLGLIECDAPDKDIYRFNGKLTLNDSSLEALERLPRMDAKAGETPSRSNTEEFIKKDIELGRDNLLLRGSSLRNTEAVLGVVVYPGHETKIMKNATQAPSKRSSIERQIDGIIFAMFGLLALMCGSGSILNVIWTNNKGPDMYYLAPEAKDYEFDPDGLGVQALANVVTSFILYGYLIPISLYVSIEMVKVVQVMVMKADPAMCHAEESEVPGEPPALTYANPRTSNLNEELGQVDVVLSDKTGTLTRNVMEFFKCSIAGVVYGRGFTEIQRANARRTGVALVDEDVVPGSAAPPQRKVMGFNFHDNRLRDPAWRSSPDVRHMQDFFRALAVCHTVIPEEARGEAGEIRYQAESPDEQAFVAAAREFGSHLVRRTVDTVGVRERRPGEAEGAAAPEVTYKVLNTIEFDSDRKRMSVIFQAPGQLDYTLFCKGADEVILQRQVAQPSVMAAQTFADATEFASAGLRTLILAKRTIPAEEYLQWRGKWDAAKKADRSQREGIKAALAEEIERDLEVFAATAVEDKLQEGVPETLEQLLRAGLKVWMLTGDKKDTAKKIGSATGLINSRMLLLEVDLDDDEAHPEARVTEALTQCERDMAELDADARADGAAMVIVGGALGYVLADEALSQTFLRVAIECHSVICCRVAPKQKADITSLVRASKRRTLAIGDGANDVAMIQAAHVGVGISGQEGRQAVMSSDFAIAQFRFLERLLLDHGRWSYKRIGRMVGYFFYKNLLFGMVLYWYNSVTFFSGQTIFVDYYMSAYNVMFVALPIIVVGAIDQDLPDSYAKEFPQLYMQGQRNEYFDVRVKALWMINAFYQSVILFVIPTYAMYLVADSKDGRKQDMWALGTTIYTCVVLAVNLEAAMVINFWTWIHHTVIWGSIIAWYLFLMGWGALDPSTSGQTYHIFWEVLAPAPSYWLIVGLTVTLCLLPDAVFRAMQRVYFPQDHHVIQAIMLARKEASSVKVMFSRFKDRGAEPLSPPAALPDMDRQLPHLDRQESNATSASAHAVVAQAPPTPVPHRDSFESNASSAVEADRLALRPSPMLVAAPGESPRRLMETEMQPTASEAYKASPPVFSDPRSARGASPSGLGTVPFSLNEDERAATGFSRQPLSQL